VFPPNKMPSKYLVYVSFNLLLSSLFAQLSFFIFKFLVENWFDALSRVIDRSASGEV